ncbi:glycosyltransferase family 2 protein [Gammaproteobacteria bacterium]|nr:glycosyltransferase family 2 protein [Gammaproteobacteria bacterium]
MTPLISIVIPLNEEPDQVILQLLESIENQKLQADEIVIVGTGNSKSSQKKQFQSRGIDVKYFYEKNLLPGAARNFGAKKTKNNFIAFLDASTRPDPDWLENSSTILHEESANLVIGKTKFQAQTYFQKILRACSYGKKAHETVPGTLIKKTVFMDNIFIEWLRAGEDQEWKQRIALEHKISVPNEALISYFGFPKNINRAIKKYFTYSVSAAFVEVQNNLKDLYLSLVLVFSALIIPRWNYLLPDWDKSPWYVDDVSKKYLILICAIFFLANIANRLVHSNLRLGLFSNTSLKLIIFLGLSLLIYNWNRLFADWVGSALLYIPHITKIYILLIIIITFFMRGIYFPLKRQISHQFLFPVNWIIVGCLGLILDLIKLPGYTFGALRSLTKRSGL